MRERHSVVSPAACLLTSVSLTLSHHSRYHGTSLPHTVYYSLTIPRDSQDKIKEVRPSPSSQPHFYASLTPPLHSDSHPYALRQTRQSLAPKCQSLPSHERARGRRSKGGNALVTSLPAPLPLSPSLFPYPRGSGLKELAYVGQRARTSPSNTSS